MKNTCNQHNEWASCTSSIGYNT